MTDSVFAGDQNPAPNDGQTPSNPTQQTQAPSNEDILGMLVGDGKKFATVEELAKGKAESDQFIDQLKGEGEQMRETIATLQAQLEESKQLTETKLEQIASDAANRQPAELDPNAIQEVVVNTVNGLKVQETQAANIKAFDDALLKHYDGKMEEASAGLTEKATALGVSVDYILEQGKQSPKAAMAMLGLDKPRTTVDSMQDAGAQGGATPPVGQGGQLTGGLNTQADFDQLRKSDPKRFYQADIQNKLFKMKKAGQL